MLGWINKILFMRDRVKSLFSLLLRARATYYVRGLDTAQPRTK